jgi:hypothetical protein
MDGPKQRKGQFVLNVKKVIMEKLNEVGYALFVDKLLALIGV